MQTIKDNKNTPPSLFKIKGIWYYVGTSNLNTANKIKTTTPPLALSPAPPPSEIIPSPTSLSSSPTAIESGLKIACKEEV